MAQLHGVYRGIEALRPTDDVDILVHVETTRGVAAETARALESLGYRFTPSIDERSNRHDGAVSGRARASAL